jgi:hypothetical protein
MAVAVSVAVTFAPGTTLPPGSVIVPSRLPPSPAQSGDTSTATAQILILIPTVRLLENIAMREMTRWAAVGPPRLSSYLTDGLIMMGSPASGLSVQGLRGASPKVSLGDIYIFKISVLFSI